MRPVSSIRFISRSLGVSCILFFAFIFTNCSQNTFSIDSRNPVDAQVIVQQEADDAIHRFSVPEPGDWNGDVVVYAHGFVPPVADVAIPAEAGMFSELFGSMGYAFAVTSYPENGMVVGEGLADLVDLADEFTTEYPQTGKVLLFGISLGGLMAAQAAERHPETFDGVLTLSGPYGSMVAVISHLATFRIVFDYFFPGLIPGDALHVPEGTAEEWETGYIPMLAAVFSDPQNSDKVRQLLAVTKLPVDVTDPENVVTSMIETLSLQIYATEDIRVRLGEIPFGNRFRWYRGSDNDRKLNAGVKRFVVDPSAVVNCGKLYGTTGKIGVPVVSLHCTGDHLIPFSQQLLYKFKISLAGKSHRFNAISVPGYGHAFNFTQEQIVSSFATMVGMVEESEVAAAGKN